MGVDFVGNPSHLANTNRAFIARDAGCAGAIPVKANLLFIKILNFI